MLGLIFTSETGQLNFNGDLSITFFSYSDLPFYLSLFVVYLTTLIVAQP
jgi:hypothetical protein